MPDIIEVSSEHPLNKLEHIIERLRENGDEVSSKSALLVLPDGISVDNAKESVLQKYGSRDVRKIEFTTFEKLSKKIIEKSGEDWPTLLPSELKRMFIVESIREIRRTNNLASKISGLIEGSEVPETEPVVEEIDSEFDDFIRCTYPPNKEDLSEEYYSELVDLARDMAEEYGDFYKNKNLEALDFYRKLEREVKDRVEEFMESDRSYYLSSARIVSKASKLLSQNNSLFENLYPNLSKIWISGISVFDVTTLNLIKQLSRISSLEINIGTASAERLTERLENQEDLEVSIKGNMEYGGLNEDNIELYEIPDERRETEFVISKIADDISKGRKEKDIAVFARNIDNYSSSINGICENYGISHHIRKRRNLSLSPSFNLISSILDLLTKAELGEEIEASEITDPLRLGFTHNWTVSPLGDKRFLRIERKVNRIGGDESHGWEEWKKKLENRSGIIDNLINWVEDRKQEISSDSLDDSLNRIRDLLMRFKNGCFDWEPQYRIKTGFEGDKQALKKEHITSQADRILKSFPQISDFIETYREISDRSELNWADVKRAFFAVMGSMTYGIQNRDAQAIRFTEAGISHFISAKKRYVVGLKSGAFPRECPSGKLLGVVFRKKVNQQKSFLYFRGPKTDFENEKDFFEAVRGPDSENQLIFTMPYLDEQGHSEDWSTFVFKHKENSERVPASKTIISDSGTASPRKHYNEVSHSLSGKEGLEEKYENEKSSELPSISEQLIQEEILSRLRLFEQRVLNHRNQNIEISEEDEEYIQPYIQDVKNTPVPAPELDLYQECPLAYYFYKFYYAMGSYLSDNRSCKGNRAFIPEWKEDFDLGPTPSPLWRKHISTDMQIVLQEILEKYDDLEDLSRSLGGIDQVIAEAEENTSVNLGYSENLIENILEHFKNLPDWVEGWGGSSKNIEFIKGSIFDDNNTEYFRNLARKGLTDIERIRKSREEVYLENFTSNGPSDTLESFTEVGDEGCYSAEARGKYGTEIDLGTGKINCSCRDYQKRKKICKHLLRLIERIGEEDPEKERIILKSIKKENGNLKLKPNERIPSLDYEKIIPDLVSFPASIKVNGNQVFFARLGPKDDRDSPYFINEACDKFVFLANSSEYRFFGEFEEFHPDYPSFVENIRHLSDFKSFHSSEYHEDSENRCKYCVYQSLCGDWGLNHD